MKITISAILSLLVVGLLGASMTASAQGNQGNDNFVKVFIHFEDTPGNSEHGLVRAFGGEITHSYTIIPAVAAEIPESSIQGLLRNPHIVAIEEDHEVDALGVTYDTEYEHSWGVGQIESGVVHENGNRGAGIKIGIIDSGIDYTHPELDDNYRGGYDFYYYDNDPMDVYGHGTHVAGTACAEDNDNGRKWKGNWIGVVGVAPECDLYSLRVLGDSGSGFESDIVYAIEWALGRTIDIYWDGVLQDTVTGEVMDVVNLSLGSDQAYSLASELTFQEAADEGLIIVAAAGNSGNAAGTGENVIWPANYDSVIAVAATDINNERASFSSTGLNVELAAPGASVYSTWNDRTSAFNPQPFCTKGGNPECYKFGSGTSMASPHVAGVAALLLASGVDPINVRTVMQDTAIDLGVSGRDQQYGYGLVSIQGAVAPIATGILDGNVINASSSPIIGALVEAGGHTAYTDSAGYYVINDIETGNYTVTVSATGYSVDSSNADITENSTTSVNFTFT